MLAMDFKSCKTVVHVKWQGYLGHIACSFLGLTWTLTVVPGCTGYGAPQRNEDPAGVIATAGGSYMSARRFLLKPARPA